MEFVVVAPLVTGVAKAMKLGDAAWWGRDLRKAEGAAVAGTSEGEEEGASRDDEGDKRGRGEEGTVDLENNGCVCVGGC